MALVNEFDSPHWDWKRGTCRIHQGQKVPCQKCILGNHSDLKIVVPPDRTPSGVLEGKSHDRRKAL